MKYSQLALVLAFLASFTTHSNPIFAGVVNKEIDKKLDASPVTGKSNPTRSSLRCWQNGKLLFEEMDWQSFSVNNKSNVIAFEHKELTNQLLNLIDLGESVCLYRKIEK